MMTSLCLQTQTLETMGPYGATPLRSEAITQPSPGTQGTPQQRPPPHPDSLLQEKRRSGDDVEDPEEEKRLMSPPHHRLLASDDDDGKEQRRISSEILDKGFFKGGGPAKPKSQQTP